MKSLVILTLALTILIACHQPPVQRADSDFDATIETPFYKANGPVLLFDEAHRNFHTATGRYAPFAALVSNDGFQVKALSAPVTDDALNTASIFMIANAMGTGELNDGPAFTEQETETIKKWVSNGGALLLIADHFPFGAAVENLGNKLGIDFQKGVVQDSVHFDKTANEQSQLLFSKENGLLAEHPITNGISKIITYTGQSVKCSDSSCVSLLTLSEAAYDMSPKTTVTRDGNDTRVELTYENPQPAKGRSQGIAFNLGKGKVVCLGEAAMLTAQQVGNTKVGMNSNPDNKKFALNILRWLADGA